MSAMKMEGKQADDINRPPSCAISSRHWNRGTAMHLREELFGILTTKCWHSFVGFFLSYTNVADRVSP